MDPIRHMPCVKLALTRIKDVKQHLNRVHDRLPCPDCVNASAATTTEEEGANCPGGACQEQRNNVIAALDRISQTQREQLSRRLNPKLSFEKQWFQLWEILFPEAKPPATPYLSAPIEEIVGVMKGFWEHHSSRIISSVWQHGPEDTAAVNLLQAADDCSPPPLDQFANWIRATVDSLFAKFVQESKSKRILKPSSHHSQHPNAEESCDHERELTSEEERSVSTEPGESQSLEDLDPGGHDTSSEPFQDRSLEFLLFNAEMEERWLNETLPSAPEQIDDDILTLIE
jgi:hypothetical protein